MMITERGRKVAKLLILVLLTGVASMASQKAARQSAKPEASSNDNDRPQLLNADTDPTLRFPIARMGHMNGTLSFGWLDISRSMIRYRVEQPADKSPDSFEVSHAQVRIIGFQGLFLEFSNPKYNRIFYLPPGEWDSFRGGFSIVSAAQGGSGGTGSIMRAMQSFDFALSLAKPAAPETPAVVANPPTPAAPSPQPAAPAAAPNLVLINPEGAGGGQAVECDTSPLVVRGAVMDATGIPAVTINGTPANLRPQSSQTAEFWSEPLPLQPGENKFPISAVNTAHLEARLVVLIHYAPKTGPANPRALDRQKIIDLLHGGVPPAHIAEVVKQRGISFRPTPDDLNVIRAEGGSEELIQTIQMEADHQ